MSGVEVPREHVDDFEEVVVLRHDGQKATDRAQILRGWKDSNFLPPAS